MTRHSRRAIPASLVALVLLAICVIAAISIVQELAGRPPLVPLGDLGRHVRTLHLDGTIMVSAGAVAAAAGLVLLGCAIVPGRPGTLALATSASETPDGAGAAHLVAGVSRPGLQKALGTAVADVDGVSAARVRVRPHRVSARVRTELNSTMELRDAVSDVLDHRLDQSGLARRPDVRIRVRQDRRRAAA